MIHHLEQEINRIAATSKATVGVYTLHLDSGQSIGLNADRRFPMASVYKVPIAIQLLRRVEQGHLTLNDMIEVQGTDISPGSGMIKEHLLEPGVMLSVRNLLSLTLRISDNTASDIVLRLAGGADAVTEFLCSVELGDIRIDRPLKRLLADFYGVTNLPSEEEWSLQDYRNRFNAVSQETKRSAQVVFLSDPRDTCTPQAMVSLLALLQRGALLNQTHTDLLLTSLRNSQMSPGRIKGLLPPGITVAHKGGTLSENVINDVGLIRLPQGAGEVAVAVFVKATGKAVPEHERVIAHIARSIYDYFLFVPSTR